MSIDEVERRRNGHAQSCKCDECHRQDALIFEQPVDCREAFEAWAKNDYAFKGLEFETHLSGEYVNYYIGAAYKAWKAARKPKRESGKRGDKTPIYGEQTFTALPYDSTERYPRSVITFASDKQTSNIHPTQKPVTLCEYLIRTYTNEGDTVLDNCMGSGTTGIACLNTNRKFIGIESDPVYFAAASERIMANQSKGGSE